MEHNDKIKDLFSDKLGNFESSVRPELWSNITSQIGATTTVATVSTGVSLFTKTIIGVSVAAAIGGFGYFAWNKESLQADKNDIQVTADKKETKENSTKSSLSDVKSSVQSNGNIEKVIGAYSTNEMVGEFSMPTSEDFVDVLLENKELPISNVQVADTKVPEAVEEQKPVNAVIKEEHSTEHSNSPSNSNTLPEKEKVALELTNVFTPNNDGANDYFEIKSEGLTDFSLVVLDMNGKPVFQTTDPNFKWDGLNMLNEKVNDGNYLYYLTARDVNGNLISRSQSLSITTTAH